MIDEEKFLTAAEAADVAGVVPRTVHDWIKRGELPGRLLSRKSGYRVAQSDLYAYLRGQSALDRAGEALRGQGKIRDNRGHCYA